VTPLRPETLPPGINGYAIGSTGIISPPLVLSIASPTFQVPSTQTSRFHLVTAWCCFTHYSISCFGLLRLGARRKLTTPTMGLSKTNRIIILLVIDIAFFLLELITGMDYLTPSGAAMSFADPCRP